MIFLNENIFKHEPNALPSVAYTGHATPHLLEIGQLVVELLNYDFFYTEKILCLVTDFHYSRIDQQISTSASENDQKYISEQILEMISGQKKKSVANL